MSATIDGRPIKDFALVRQCDGCGMTTAADLDATDEHFKQMEMPGQSVRRVVLEECLRLWKTARPCACKTVVDDLAVVQSAIRKALGRFNRHQPEGPRRDESIFWMLLSEAMASDLEEATEPKEKK